MILYSKILRFEMCVVEVRADDEWHGRPEIHVSAGSTVSPEEALVLAETILAARRAAIGAGGDRRRVCECDALGRSLDDECIYDDPCPRGMGDQGKDGAA